MAKLRLLDLLIIKKDIELLKKYTKMIKNDPIFAL